MYELTNNKINKYQNIKYELPYSVTTVIVTIIITMSYSVYNQV